MRTLHTSKKMCGSYLQNLQAPPPPPHPPSYADRHCTPVAGVRQTRTEIERIRRTGDYSSGGTSKDAAGRVCGRGGGGGGLFKLQNNPYAVDRARAHVKTLIGIGSLARPS